MRIPPPLLPFSYRTQREDRRPVAMVAYAFRHFCVSSWIFPSDFQTFLSPVQAKTFPVYANAWKNEIARNGEILIECIENTQMGTFSNAPAESYDPSEYVAPYPQPNLEDPKQERWHCQRIAEVCQYIHVLGNCIKNLNLSRRGI